MNTYPITSSWFLSRGHINNHFCIGYGKTPLEAIRDAFKDYAIIINL